MSAQESNELTLEGIAQRLEALERENERMRSENAELRDQVSALRDPRTHRDMQAETRGSDRSRYKEAASEFDGQVSRRSLLSKAGAAALAAVAAGTLLGTRKAEADHFGPVISANRVSTHHLLAESDEGFPAIGVESIVPNHIAVYGEARRGYGLWGYGKNGVIGKTVTEGHAAVSGEHLSSIVGGYGVVGDGGGRNYAGVLGRNKDAGGSGVTGDGSPGVQGIGRGSGAAGVYGIGNEGYGGSFSGAVAQLILKPADYFGKPTGGKFHQMGEIYLDGGATLFVCTNPGNPGTWRRIVTAPV